MSLESIRRLAEKARLEASRVQKERLEDQRKQLEYEANQRVLKTNRARTYRAAALAALGMEPDSPDRSVLLLDVQPTYKRLLPFYSDVPGHHLPLVAAQLRGDRGVVQAYEEAFAVLRDDGIRTDAKSSCDALSFALRDLSEPMEEAFNGLRYTIPLVPGNGVLVTRGGDIAYTGDKYDPQPVLAAYDVKEILGKARSDPNGLDASEAPVVAAFEGVRKAFNLRDYPEGTIELGAILSPTSALKTLRGQVDEVVGDVTNLEPTWEAMRTRSDVQSTPASLRHALLGIALFAPAEFSEWHGVERHPIVFDYTNNTRGAQIRYSLGGDNSFCIEVRANVRQAQLPGIFDGQPYDILPSTVFRDAQVVSTMPDWEQVIKEL